MPTEEPDRADVELRLPADRAYVSVVRTTAAALAARLDFTMDDIEDLRIAVGEACAMTLAEAPDGSDMRCRFHLGDAGITVSVTVPTGSSARPDYDSFAWQVLNTLASRAEANADEGRFTIAMTVHSELAAS